MLPRNNKIPEVAREAALSLGMEYMDTVEYASCIMRANAPRQLIADCTSMASNITFSYAREHMGLKEVWVASARIDDEQVVIGAAFEVPGYNKGVSPLYHVFTHVGG